MTGPGPDTNPHRAGEALTLMVIDDDPSVLLLIDVTERLGLKVKAAGNGLQALEQLRDGLRPDLILLDLMMERIDGVTFLGHLKEMPWLAGTPVIAMSTEAVLEHYAPQLQVDGTLVKPISRQNLAACLEKHLARD